jgi:predicted peroxiredoxin
MHVLNIVSSGYRATIEEQDDTVVWISHAMRNGGADIDLLLRGAASNYPVAGQVAKPISLGGRAQKHGPDVHGQIRQLMDSGARIYVVREDLEKRAIAPDRMIAGVEVLDSSAVPELFAGYDQVWHW